MGRPRLQDSGAQEEVETEMEYFRGNAERMRYAKFRGQGLFVGSGVVEAGCKTIFGQRLKLSGMHWTVSSANAITALRCCHSVGVGKASGSPARQLDLLTHKFVARPFYVLVLTGCCFCTRKGSMETGRHTPRPNSRF
jgi:hypothetical protein